MISVATVILLKKDAGAIAHAMINMKFTKIILENGFEIWINMHQIIAFYPKTGMLEMTGMSEDRESNMFSLSKGSALELERKLETNT